MVENRGRLERLYLGKGDTDECNVFVDTIQLPQHQYDGIRFLYRQFKKGKAGVILNDPTGYGKRVQTVLFFNAISPFLTQPTLILCSEGKERAWNHEFYKWTNIGPGVSIQHGSEHNRTQHLIGNFSQVHMFSRRDWGIVVVEDNHILREVLRSGISAKYKIWITTIDMKKNLQTFSVIYKWLYQRDRFIVEDFQSSRKTPTAMLAKSTKLDAFMADIVIRRRDVKLPLGNTNHTADLPKVSRKNKDTTGKKIKRSKPANDHVTSCGLKEIASEIIKNIPVVTKNGTFESKKDNTEEIIINIEKEVNTKKDAGDVNDMEQSNVTTDNSKVEKYFANKSDSKNEVQKISDEVNVKLNTHTMASNEDIENNLVVEPNTQNDSLALLNSGSILSQNIIIKYDSDTPDINDEVLNDDVPPKKQKLSNETDFTTNDNNKKIPASDDVFSMCTIPSDNKSENKVNNHDVKSDIVDLETNNIKNSDNVLSTAADLPTNELNSKMERDDLNCIKNELDDIINVSENNETGSKLEGVELKMKQMEELAMKKFKGSVLDNIF